MLPMTAINDSNQCQRGEGQNVQRINPEKAPVDILLVIKAFPLRINMRHHDTGKDEKTIEHKGKVFQKHPAARFIVSEIIGVVKHNNKKAEREAYRAQLHNLAPEFSVHPDTPLIIGAFNARHMPSVANNAYDALSRLKSETRLTFFLIPVRPENSRNFRANASQSQYFY